MSSTVACEIFPHYSLIFRRSNSIYPEVPWTYSRDICHKAWEVNNKHFITYSTACLQKYQFYYWLLRQVSSDPRAFCLKEWERCACSPICAWRLKVFSARFLRRYSESPSREYKDRWPKPQRKTSKANNHQWRMALSRTTAPLGYCHDMVCFSIRFRGYLTVFLARTGKRTNQNKLRLYLSFYLVVYHRKGCLNH